MRSSDSSSGTRRVLAIPGEQVEGELRIEDFLRLAFERQQADGLLLQLVDAARAPFACRLENMRQRTCDLVLAVKPVQHQRDGDGGAIGDDVDRIVAEPRIPPAPPWERAGVLAARLPGRK